MALGVVSDEVLAATLTWWRREMGSWQARYEQAVLGSEKQREKHKKLKAKSFRGGVAAKREYIERARRDAARTIVSTKASLDLAERMVAVLERSTGGQCSTYEDVDLRDAIRLYCLFLRSNAETPIVQDRLNRMFGFGRDPSAAKRVAANKVMLAKLEEVL